MADCERFCGARLSSVLGYCDRKGKPEHGWLCWQHRKPTPDDIAASKAERIRVHQYGEAKADAEVAKSRFTRFGNELLADLIEAHESEPSELPSDLRTRVAKLCDLSAALGAAVRKMDGFSE